MLEKEMFVVKFNTICLCTNESFDNFSSRKLMKQSRKGMKSENENFVNMFHMFSHTFFSRLENLKRVRVCFRAEKGNYGPDKNR
jgi:hypothetical protein